jgi:hypothetical protein
MTKSMWNNEAVKAYESGQGVVLVEKPYPHYEPVAWGMEQPDGDILDVISPEEHARLEGGYTVPLYRQRTWVGLTDEDELDWEEGGNLKDLVKAIETKLKDKNESKN